MLRRSKSHAAHAFTLMEVLIVLSLLTAVSLAVMTSFLQGIKVFSRFRGAEDGMEQSFLIEQLTHDLKNGADYSLLPWVLSKNTISFASVPTVDENAENASDVLPSRVIYRLDPEKNEVIRAQSFPPYDGLAVQTSVLAHGVRSMVFDVVRDNEEKIPSRVSVSIEYGDASHPHFLKKDILIPVGYAETGVR